MKRRYRSAGVLLWRIQPGQRWTVLEPGNPLSGQTHRVSDLERLSASGAGPAAVAAELTGRVRAEFPVIGALDDRDQVLVAALPVVMGCAGIWLRHLLHRW